MVRGYRTRVLDQVPTLGVSENFGILIIRILLFRVLYQGPLFSETPIMQSRYSVKPSTSEGSWINSGLDLSLV